MDNLIFGDEGEANYVGSARVKAANPHANGEVLSGFLTHPDKVVRLRAITNPNLPHEAMVRVAKKGNVEMRKMLAKWGHLFPALQRLLLRDPAIGVLRELASNENLATEALEVLAKNKDCKVRLALARRTGLPGSVQLLLARGEVAGKKGRSKDLEEVQVALAGNQHSEAKVLAILANGNQKTRVLVASHPLADETTLGVLATDDAMEVRVAVALNSNSTAAILTSLILDQETWWELARNPNLPTQLAGVLAYHGDDFIQRTVFTNPNLGEADQFRLAIELPNKPLDQNELCNSERVVNWLQRKEAEKTTIDRETGRAEYACGELHQVIEFANKEDATDEIFNQAWEVRGLICGWWEPSMGDEWYCVVDNLLPGEFYGGMAKRGSEDLMETRLWKVGDREDAKLWLHGEWEIKEVGPELVATTWASKVMSQQTPEFPRLQDRYFEGGKPETVRGILRVGVNLMALWADEAGNEVGWEKIDNQAAAWAPHEVELLSGKQIVDNAILWERFESALRAVAYGRSI